MDMLKVENLSVSYGELTILRNVSFSLRPGEWLMIVGPNGAGKSTLINAITGGVPSQGRIWFQGRNTRAMKAHELARGVVRLRDMAASTEEEVPMGEVVSKLTRA